MRIRHARGTGLVALITLATANGVAAGVWTVTSATKPDARIVHDLQALARQERATLRFGPTTSMAVHGKIAKGNLSFVFGL